MNTVLNNVNFNVSTKIQFLQSELNNTNLNITTKIKYVDSLVNNTTNNIILQLAIENTTLNNVCGVKDWAEPMVKEGIETFGSEE